MWVIFEQNSVFYKLFQINKTLKISINFNVSVPLNVLITFSIFYSKSYKALTKLNIKLVSLLISYYLE